MQWISEQQAEVDAQEVPTTLEEVEVGIELFVEISCLIFLSTDELKKR